MQAGWASSAAASLVASGSQPSQGACAAAGARELGRAARCSQRQMGNGCVSALTFCCQMSKCVCASLVLPQQLLC